MMNILYTVGKGLYVNLTNSCPCSCEFCIRYNGDGAYGSDSLWLDRDPSQAEVIEALSARKLSDYDEIIFCGFGEPTEALDKLLAACRYIRSISDAPPIRINTNGLSDLINGRPTAELFEGLVDTVSISLNAGNASDYCLLCHPSFGKKSYQAILDFAIAVNAVVDHVVFTLVSIVSERTIAECQKVADSCGIPLRVRKYDS